MKLKRYILLGIVIVFSLHMSNVVFAMDGIKQIIQIDNKKMNVYMAGSGNKTIVMLSGFGTEKPIDDFMPLVDKFSNEYKVVVLEFFGYGTSDITEDERSNKNIVREIREVLDNINVNPPYIFVPHSMSGIYSIYYANKYPSEVSAIIGIDMSLPQKQLERWSYETFEKEKISVELDGYNISIINQWNKFYDNSKELENVKYPFNIPVLMFLASEQVKMVDDMIDLGKMKTNWYELNNNMITNNNIQFIKVLEGSHYLHHECVEEIFKFSKEFIDKKVI